jgi:DNA-binding MarR family transcriptional regulator
MTISSKNYDVIMHLYTRKRMSTQNRFPAPRTVPRAVGRLRVALDDAYLRASRAQGLTAQQAELLCAVLRPAPIGALATTLRCDQSNVTRLVDRAAKRGLLRRRGDQEDGRVTVVELSPKGRTLAEQFISALESQLDELLAAWPDRRQQDVIGALNQISDALDTATPKLNPPTRRTK